MLEKIQEMRDTFCETCHIIAHYFPEKPFHLRGRINYAAMDSIFNAVAQIGSNKKLFDNYSILIKDSDFIHTTTNNTSDVKILHRRFQRAMDILSA